MFERDRRIRLMPGPGKVYRMEDGPEPVRHQLPQLRDPSQLAELSAFADQLNKRLAAEYELARQVQARPSIPFELFGEQPKPKDPFMRTVGAMLVALALAGASVWLAIYLGFAPQSASNLQARAAETSPTPTALPTPQAPPEPEKGAGWKRRVERSASSLTATRQQKEETIDVR